MVSSGRAHSFIKPCQFLEVGEKINVYLLERLEKITKLRHQTYNNNNNEKINIPTIKLKQNNELPNASEEELRDTMTKKFKLLLETQLERN